MGKKDKETAVPAIAPKCINCKWWKPEQAELEYCSTSGFCISPALNFTVRDGQSVVVLDRKNPSGKYRNTQQLECNTGEHTVNNLTKSQYVLVTDIDFGCINFEERPASKSWSKWKDS